MSIGVVIGTYGDYGEWRELAKRAADSVFGAAMVEHFHGETLAQARNYGAEIVNTDRLVFLDADDELEHSFVRKVVENEDVLQPKTIYRYNKNSETPPQWIDPRENFLMGNHIVVGAPVRRNLFISSGGFDEYPIAEDWALWLKLRSMGATFGRTTATYIINVNPNSRNTKDDAGTYELIRKRFG